MQPPHPDVILVGAEWRSRALLRAQLTEEGSEVLATDTWGTAWQWLQSGSQPWLVIVDLQGLPNPEAALHDLSRVMNRGRVLVLGAAASVPAETLQDLGFEILRRPIAVGTIVAAARRLIERAKAEARP